MTGEDGDLPQAELVALAEETLQRYKEVGLPAEIYFKATCPACGERCLFQEPNAMYPSMECAACQHTFPFERGGFMIVSRT